jgi:hypothetical protein
MGELERVTGDQMTELIPEELVTPPQSSPGQSKTVNAIYCIASIHFIGRPPHGCPPC